MDAAKAMMAGVAALGVFAVLQLRKTSRVSPQTTEPGALPPASPAPGTPFGRPSGARLTFLSDPLSLTQGQTYRGRLQLPAEAGPLSQASTSPELAAALGLLGFASDAKLYMSEAELPPDWPEEAVRGAGGRTRWFRAAWSLPSVQFPRPPAIDLMWVAAGPAVTSGWAG